MRRSTSASALWRRSTGEEAGSGSAGSAAAGDVKAPRGRGAVASVQTGEKHVQESSCVPGQIPDSESPLNRENGVDL